MKNSIKFISAYNSTELSIRVNKKTKGGGLDYTSVPLTKVSPETHIRRTKKKITHRLYRYSDTGFDTCRNKRQSKGASLRLFTDVLYWRYKDNEQKL